MLESKKEFFSWGYDMYVCFYWDVACDANCVSTCNISGAGTCDSMCAGGYAVNKTTHRCERGYFAMHVSSCFVIINLPLRILFRVWHQSQLTSFAPFLIRRILHFIFHHLLFGDFHFAANCGDLLPVKAKMEQRLTFGIILFLCFLKTSSKWTVWVATLSEQKVTTSLEATDKFPACQLRSALLNTNLISVKLCR